MLLTLSWTKITLEEFARAPGVFKSGFRRAKASTKLKLTMLARELWWVNTSPITARNQLWQDLPRNLPLKLKTPNRISRSSCRRHVARHLATREHTRFALELLAKPVALVCEVYRTNFFVNLEITSVLFLLLMIYRSQDKSFGEETRNEEIPSEKIGLLTWSIL